MKSSTLTTTLLNLFFGIVQTSFFPTLLGNSVNPNLIGTLCFALLLSQNFSGAYISAFVGGLFLDLVSAGTLGLNALLLTLFVWLYSSLHSFYLRNKFVGILFAVIAFYLIRLITVHNFGFIFDGWILVGSFFTATLGYLFSLLFEKRA